MKTIITIITLAVVSLSISFSTAMALDVKSPKVREAIAFAKKKIEGQSINAKYIQKTLGSEMAFETKLEGTSLGKENLEILYYLTFRKVHEMIDKDELGGFVVLTYSRLQAGNYDGEGKYDELYRDLQNPKILVKFIERNVLIDYK